MRTNKYSAIVQLVLASSIVLVSTLCTLSTKAASAYHVTLSTSNFALQTVSVSADDLSNPSRAMFHLQNGTAFWYTINVQSTPTGMTLTPADASDPVTATFLNSPLLPPAGVLPFDRSNGTFTYETLRLALAFSGPGQQVQLTLNPFDTHAVTLDVLTLLLQLLGQRNGLSQIGLLAPNGLQAIFNAASTMKDFTSLTNDYMQLLQSASSANINTPPPDGTNAGVSLTQAYACAKDIVTLLTDQSEQLLLSTVLWNVTGKTISRASLLNVTESFSNAQFGLGIEGFLADEAQVMGASLFQTSSPTILLQTVSTTPATPSPTATETTSPAPQTPDPTPTTTATPTVTP